MGDRQIDIADISSLRRKFFNEEIRRYRIAYYSLFLISLSTLIFLVAVVFKGFDKPEWQFVVLLAFATICAALPILSKVNLTKDGGSFEVTNPLDLIDEFEARAQAARTESFEQTRQQISGLSVQISELYDLVAERAERGGTPEISPKGPTLRDIRKKLNDITDYDDPQKGRFGTDESKDGTRRLTAKVEPSEFGGQWQKLIVTVTASAGHPLRGRHAYFFLHDTFDPDVYRVKIDPGALSVSLETASKGAFTVGAVVDNDQTLLELDLASKKVKAPAAWKKR